MKKLQLLVPLFLLLLLAVPALLADAAVQRVHYGAPGEDYVDVLGGNLILLQNDACSDKPPPARGEPVVVPLGEPLIMTFLLKPCGLLPPKAEPTLTCSWILTPDRPLDGSCRCAETLSVDGCLDLQGVQGEFEAGLGKLDGSFLRFEEAIDVPQTLGRYRLEMSCGTVGGTRKSEISETLFVTYGKPLDWVSPVDEDWLHRGTCWAEGLGASASEDAVIEAVQDGLYRWGRQGNLRYGYARADADAPEGSGSYLFPTEAGMQRVIFPADSVEDSLNCPGKNCKCHWQNLVDADRSCDFADCYNFSRTLQGISATLGIGGLMPFVSLGASDAGFLTKAAARSIDSRFPGNLDCVEGLPCYSYLFGSHSVRLRNGRIYDPTFGATYASEDEMIAADLLNWSPPSFETSDPEVIVVQKESEYGNWGFYDLKSHEHAKAKSVGEYAEPIGARLTGKVDFSPTSPGEGGFSSMLLAEVEIEILREGTYFVDGVLSWKDPKSGENEPIAWHPSIETSTRSRSGIESAPGMGKLELRFSGEQIYQAGKNGSYELILLVQDAQQHRIGGRVVVPTPEYRAEDFGELGARAVVKETPFGLDWDGDQSFDALIVPVELSVRVASEYGLELRLHHGSQTVAYSSRQIEEPRNSVLRRQITGERAYEVGEHTIYGVFLPEALREHVRDAEHQVTVLVFDDRLRALAGETTPLFEIEEKKFFPKAPYPTRP